MSYDDAMEALSNDALKLIKNNQVIGLGSGRAATSLVKSLAKLIKLKNYNIRGIPTSLQIKLVAEKAGIKLIESDQVNHIDIVFDGADQIDSQKYVIKGGGGALLRENILNKYPPNEYSELSIDDLQNYINDKIQVDKIIKEATITIRNKSRLVINFSI